MPGRGSDRVVTMSDIARAAGVSMATASRALNNAAEVSPGTRERVVRVAAELEYVVSPEASGLARRRTGRVGVILTHLSRWFYGEILEGIEPALRAAGLDLMVYMIGDAAERRRFFADLPARRKVDAVIVVGMPVSPEERERLALMDVAVVAAGGQVAEYPFVSIDDEVAGRQAMDHLLFLGHRRIAMLDAIDPNVAEWPIELRSRAYVRALERAGLDLEDELFVRTPWGARGGTTGMEQLLSLTVPPTAVFAHSDEMAFGALATLRRAGVRVPQDISIIGIDGHPIGEQLDLTTVHQDARRQGRLAARAVTTLLSGRDPSAAEFVPTRLVPRGSTGCPRRLP
jgi:LacI family transcriptional regulator, repressor for deo operon, udp, cdd, tsx, nupC, and nupG